MMKEKYFFNKEDLNQVMNKVYMKMLVENMKQKMQLLKIQLLEN